MNLSQTRQNNGISLQQIAETTKISMWFLRAIEAQDYEKLPGGIFATSYLRQYAAAAGVDPEPLLSEYTAFLNPEGQGDTNQRRTFLDRWFRMPAAQRS